jgi:integrase
MAYRFEGKQKTLSFGPYPATSLARAREKRHEAKACLQNGIDPMAKAKAEKQEQIALTQNTFEKIAKELILKLQKEGKAKVTISKKRWLVDMANVDLGTRPIADISAAEILVPLRKVEDKGNYETARRLRSTIGQVFRYAIATARAENDPTYALRGALIAPQVQHHAAFTERAGFSGLVRAIWDYEGAPETQAALKLMALLYTRPGELRLAHWSEFDLDKAVWAIPATRMKMRKEHVKPLSLMAVSILRDLYALTGNGDLVFPSALSRGKPISENTLNGSLRRMGFTKEECTSHGFRASASSLLNESGKWSSDAIEAELAHVGADQVRRAYHRANYWQERVEMAESWANDIRGMLGAV